MAGGRKSSSVITSPINTSAGSPAPATSGAAERGSSETASTGPEAAEGKTMNEKLALEMRLYRNVKYHEDRQGHYEWLNRWCSFFIFASGSAGLAAGLSSTAPVLWAFASGGAALLGAAQLVFDFSGKAHKHQDLRKSMIKLMAKASSPAAVLESINFEMIELYGEEPEIFHAVNMLAYNAAQKAFGRPDSTLVKLSWFQTAARNWFRFDPANFSDNAAH